MRKNEIDMFTSIVVAFMNGRLKRRSGNLPKIIIDPIDNHGKKWR